MLETFYEPSTPFNGVAVVAVNIALARRLRVIDACYSHQAFVESESGPNIGQFFGIGFETRDPFSISESEPEPKSATDLKSAQGWLA